ncbi:MAG: flagellar M-ring protein FliF [Magnetococcus sp. WYHC-3]
MAETARPGREGGLLTSEPDPTIGGWLGQVLPLGGRNQILLAAFAAIIALTVMIWFATRPEYKVLFSGLPEEETARVVEQLSKLNVPYQLGGNNTLIEVPSDRLHDVRLEMASQGFPKNVSGVGFEIFDQKSITGMTDFMQRMNYQRALQGELARSIESIDSVNKARVHLVLPKRSMFMSEQKEASASVVMELVRPLTPRQIDGISHLVASAVEGLSENQVTLLDEKGNLVAGPRAVSEDGRLPADEGLALQQRKEKQLEERAQAMLDKVIGVDKDGMRRSIVRITTELNLDQVDQQEELFDPDGQVARSQQDVVENSKGAFGVGGVPGVDPNDPNANDQSNGSGSRQSRDVERSTTNFEISKKVRSSKLAVGEIKRLSVAVLVDGVYAPDPAAKDPEKAELVYSERAPEELAKLKAMVEKAVGFNAQRGDIIEVTQAPFKSLTPPEEIKSVWLTPAFLLELVKYLSIILLGGLVTWFVLRPLVVKLLVPEKSEDDTIPSAVAELEAQLLADGVGSMPSEKPIRMMIPDRNAQLAQQMIADHLEEAREIIRSWLNE